MTLPTEILTPPSIRRQVHALRRRLYFLIAVRGLGLWLLAAGLWVGVSMLMDWSFRFPWGQRLLLLLGALALLGWVFYRRLLKPLSRRANDAQLVVWIEAAHPRLQGRWLAAVELNESSVARQGASPSLAQAAVRSSQESGEPVRLEKVIRPMFAARARGSALLGTISLLAVTLTATLPTTQPFMHLWWQRNVLLQDVAWPTRTQFILPCNADQPLIHPRGDDFELTVTVEGEVPAMLRAELRVHDGRNRAVQPVELLALGGRQHRLVVRQLLHPMQLRIAGGDAVSPWLQVQLQDRPQITQLQVSAHPPAYMNMSPILAPPGSTVFEVPAGSRVRVQMQATSALAWAKWSLPKEIEIAMQWQGGHWVGDIPPQSLASGVWTLHCADPSGLIAKPPAKLVINVTPDQPPQVQASLRGVGGLVLSRAWLPVEYAIHDDHGLAGIQAQIRWTMSDGSATLSEAFTETVKEIQEVTTRVARDTCVLDLQGRDIPVGAMLAMEIAAQDRDDVHGPNRGVSPTLFVKVVNEADLRADLLRRELEQRQELQRLLKEQEDLETEWRAMAAMAAQDDPTDSAADPLALLQRRQRSLADRVEVIHRHLQLMAEEMTHNRLEDAQGPVLTRMRQRVLEPLELMVRSQLPEILRPIEAARGTMEIPVRKAHMIQTADLQQEVARRLRGVLDAMAHWASYQQAVQLLQDTLRMQDQVHEATRRELEKRVRDVFDG